MMAKFVRFCTQVYGVYHGDKGWEYYPDKPDGLVYINPDAVKYVQQTPNGEVTSCVLFGPKEGDECVFLHQSIDSVVRALEEASRQ